VEPSQIIERERRWSRPVAVLTLLAALLSIAAVFVVASNFGAGGDAERLREVNDDSGLFVAAYVVQALGFALLAVPLLYLFSAARARSEGVRGQFVGLTVAGPLFLAAGAILTALVFRQAASDFVAKGLAGTSDHANDVAGDVIRGQSLADLITGVAIAGGLAFAFAMTYTCFQAMRAGLLTRFWGSLGAALGVASLFLSQYTPLWFIYLGLLIGGWTPKGRPPAWGAGKAIPWPTPGERAAESLRGEDGTVEGQATEVEDRPAEQIGTTSADDIGTTADPEAEKPRKRKKRRS
jgi:hypothetical protein